MAEYSRIEWTHHTFNPWIGCQHVSSGCENCYAEKLAKWRGWAAWGPGEERVLTGEANWRLPLRWNRQAEEAGERRRVFCASLADVFDAHAPQGARERLWELIRATPSLDWLLLTKLPHNIRRMLPADWGDGYPNVWLGVTAETQFDYSRRWPVLARIPAVVRFVSYEPALGPLLTLGPQKLAPDWIIAGGESGSRARPCEPRWFEALLNICTGRSIPFFFKQWGIYDHNPLMRGIWPMTREEVRELDPPENGKGGALLNGCLWRQFPVVHKQPTCPCGECVGFRQAHVKLLMEEMR